MIVVDANILAPFWTNTEFTTLSNKVHEADPDWIAPILWRSEVRNVMSLFVRQKMLTLGEALECMEQAELQMKDQEYHVNTISVLRLASESDATAYDCEYTSLAEEMEIPLVTNDRRLQANFPDIALSPEQFLDGS